MDWPSQTSSSEMRVNLDVFQDCMSHGPEEAKRDGGSKLLEVQCEFFDSDALGNHCHCVWSEMVIFVTSRAWDLCTLLISKIFTFIKMHLYVYGAFLFSVAPKILPELGKVLSDDTWHKEAPPDVVAAVCNVFHRLLLVDRDISKKTMNAKVIKGLSAISEKEWVFCFVLFSSYPIVLVKCHFALPNWLLSLRYRSEDSGSLAASKLLHNLWTDKFLKGTIKHVNL